MPAEVATIFAAYPTAIRNKLKEVRQLIFEVAKTTQGVAPLKETLKWGEPAYLPAKPRIGSTIRLGWKRSAPERRAVYFHCQTTLIGTFRTLFAEEFAFEGNGRCYCDHPNRCRRRRSPPVWRWRSLILAIRANDWP
jgi:hypothetical protein